MKKKIKINSIIMIVISCLILLLLSIYTIKYFFTPLNEQDTWHELGKMVLIINIIVAYIINIPSILSGIFSILHTNGIKLNVLSTIFSVIHVCLQILLILFMFTDPLKLFGGPTSIHDISML